MKKILLFLVLFSLFIPRALAVSTQFEDVWTVNLTYSNQSGQMGVNNFNLSNCNSFCSLTQNASTSVSLADQFGIRFHLPKPIPVDIGRYYTIEFAITSTNARLDALVSKSTVWVYDQNDVSVSGVVVDSSVSTDGYANAIHTIKVTFKMPVSSFSNISLNFISETRNIATSTQFTVNNRAILSVRTTEEIIEEGNKETQKRLDEAQETRKGILETIKSVFTTLIELPGKLVELLINALKSLIIPDSMDFIYDFVDALNNKLGFIGNIPAKIIEFTINLANATWSEVNSVTLPSISIFGYNFWNAQVIDLSVAINIFKPFLYVTNVICVVIVSRTLLKWWESFTGGSE